MPRKRANMFEESVPQGMHLVLSTPASFEAQPVQTTAEDRTVREYRKGELVLTAHSTRSQQAHTKIREIVVHGTVTYAQTAEEIEAVKTQSGRAEGAQQYVEDWCEFMQRRSGQLLIGAVEAGVRNIALELTRPLYFEDEPQRQPGFFERLFGG